MSVLDNYQDWKHFLGDRVQQAESIGMKDETIADLAYQIGGYLNDKVDPENHEERVLKDLWDVGNKEEQHAIANMMMKLVKKETH